MAAQIITFLDRPIDIDGRLARVGASLGIACTGKSGMTASELMRRADLAMYAAKDAGKNCTCVYVPAMDAARDEAAVIARGTSAAVTAEGVESGDEINLLRLAGCSELQGDHFGKPQAAAAIAAA